MQFTVPQNLEIEDKIFGPLSWKQFLYLVGGVGASVVLWQLLPGFIAAPLIVAVAIFAWALGFFPKDKYGKPFADIVESAFKYIAGTKLYTWKKREPEHEEWEMREFVPRETKMDVPQVSTNKLKDLSWNLDVRSGTSKVKEK